VSSTKLKDDISDVERVLVTGAHGFIGRHVCRGYAARGMHVTGIGHGFWPESEHKRWGVDVWHELDVNLSTLLSYADDPDIIIHCAGSGSVSFSLENPYQDFDRSVRTTLDVLEYVRTRCPKTRIIYPSSAGVYGIVTRTPIEESFSLNPVSPYGYHKQLSERLCESYANNYYVNVKILRLFSVYGRELHKQLLWDACNKILRGDYKFFGTGMEVRDWVHVEDATELIVRSADHSFASVEKVNCASGKGVTVSEIIKWLMVAFDIDAEPEFTGKERKGNPDIYVADISKATSWGWQPKINLHDGINDYVRWFKAHSDNFDTK
jgi:UDP-glucose 4-epimerase